MSEIPISHALQWARERSGWTRNQAAEPLGCHFTFIHRYESGKNIPKHEFMEQAACAMGFSSLEAMRLGELPFRIHRASSSEKRSIVEVLKRHKMPKSWVECVSHVRLPSVEVLEEIAGVLGFGSARELLYGDDRKSRRDAA